MDATYSGHGCAEVLPASSYLQERLQERRARNMRPRRTRQSDFGPRRTGDDDIFLSEAEASKNRASRLYDSSPLAPASVVGSEPGYNKRRSIGVKDMDGQMDRLNKQNFALKLELDHRREQTLKLQDQVESMREQSEKAEQLKEEHAQLLEINSKLVEELEKRDKAVEQAIDLISDLEDRMADMEDRRSQTRPSTAQADSGYAGTETHEPAPLSSPPESMKIPKTPRTRLPPSAASAASHKLASVVNVQTPARIRREPSFMSQKQPSTNALRSVYMETAQNLHPVQSFNSLLSKRDGRNEDAEDVLNSPRLSTLSESSFPSLYSPKQEISPEKYDWEGEEGEDVLDAPNPHFRQDSINRVSQWMDGDDRDLLENTPSKLNRVTSPLSQHTARDIASSPLPRIDDEASYHSLSESVTKEILQPLTFEKPYRTRAEKQQAKLPRQAQPSSMAGNIFGSPLLPPTPDSASTRMLRESRSSIVGERSILDTTPAPVKGYDALEPGLRTAPKQMRSSIELQSAYFMNRHLGNAKDDDSSSGSEDGNTETAAVRIDYNGFPDGQSIITGTPSRFIKSPKRRQSSAEVLHSSSRKPSLNRAETSPTFLSTLGRIVSRDSVSRSTMVSPHSGTSSNRTTIRNIDGPSSVNSTTSQSSITSPARSLSQRTQKLFRRLSNSQSDRSEQQAAAGLPTLTSTPSSAYAARRPSTSDPRLATRSGSRQEISQRRPSLQFRTKTEPPTVRPGSVVEVEKKNPFFTRSGSVRQRKEGSGTPPTSSSSLAMGVYTPTNEVVRPGAGKRRGSLREVVGGGGRRPWR